MIKIRSFVFLCATLCFFHAHGLRLDRVIISSDDNPTYLEFWPLVAQAWKKIVGAKPTLLLVANQNVIVDTSVGDVIRFDPVKGMPTSFQAQAIRLLAPALFENECCIVSDIDLFPLTKNYFTAPITDIPEGSFVVYRPDGYPEKDKRIPLCYNAAQGKTFKEVFKIGNIEDFSRIMKYWFSLKWNYATDEKIIYQCLHQWPAYKSLCIKLQQPLMRLDRKNWQYNVKDVQSFSYTDAHSLRPYKKYKKKIDTLLALLEIHAPAVVTSHHSFKYRATAKLHPRKVRKKRWYSPIASKEPLHDEKIHS